MIPLLNFLLGSISIQFNIGVLATMETVAVYMCYVKLECFNKRVFATYISI